MTHTKKRLLSLLALGAVFGVFQNSQPVNAQSDTATLPVIVMDDVEVVNIRDLGNSAYKFSYLSDMTENLRTAVISGNGQVIEFRENSPFAMVNGERVPLSTTKTKDGAVLPDWNDGVDFEGVDVYVPKEIVLDAFDLSESDDGLLYEKEVVEVVKEPVLEEEPVVEKEYQTIQPTEEEDIEPEEEVEEETIDTEAAETPKENVESREDEIQEESQPSESEEKEPIKEEPDEVIDEELPSNDNPLEEESEGNDEKEPIIAESDWSLFVEQAKQKVAPSTIKHYSDGSLSFEIDNQKPESAAFKTQVLSWLEENPYKYETKDTKNMTQVFIKRSLR